MNPVPLSVVDVTLCDGSVTNVRIVGGIVRQVGERPYEGDVILDGERRLALPAMAEAHAHLDKAFLSETVPNPTGDLMGAIVNMETHRHLITRTDTEARAERAARLLAANGATAIRTHADVTDGTGLDSAAALLAVRDRLSHLVRIDVIALSGWPVTGAAGAQQRALLADAIALGVDGVGGCPHLDDDEVGAVDHFLQVAADAALPVDLHTDEHLDPARTTLGHLAARVREGFPHRVAASHCVSLGMRPEEEQRRVADALAAADVSVITLPASNLYLQGRSLPVGMPRALAPLGVLRAAGVNVAAGWDNLQDPFNPVGRGDCLETAALLVMAGHMLAADAYDTVSNSARAALGLPRAGTTVGDVADLVLVNARSVREAIAMAPGARIVLREGAVMGG